MLGGPALAAEFNKVTGERGKIGSLSGAWKGAWPVDDEQEATQIFNTVKALLDSAHRYNCR